MPDTMIERATAAIIAELHRQGQASGCATEDNGSSAQVDGAFAVGPIARAVIAAMRIDDPLSSVLEVGQCTTGHWNRMIDAALAER